MKKRKDILAELEGLKKEYEKREKEIKGLAVLEDKIIELEKSLIIKVNCDSRSSGGMDTHYEHTVSLEIKGRVISNTQWDRCSILTLEEKDIQDIYEDRNVYDLENLKDYCNPSSYKKLCAYFDYMDA